MWGRVCYTSPLTKKEVSCHALSPTDAATAMSNDD